MSCGRQSLEEHCLRRSHVPAVPGAARMKALVATTFQTCSIASVSIRWCLLSRKGPRWRGLSAEAGSQGPPVAATFPRWLSTPRSARRPADRWASAPEECQRAADARAARLAAVRLLVLPTAARGPQRLSCGLLRLRGRNPAATARGACDGGGAEVLLAMRIPAIAAIAARPGLHKLRAGPRAVQI
eukprot:CAMPEP_0179207064 /NCGR_PEP_ID=MMETSP0796-20121207/103249_1 /TAXON_ID=73915 /ORGANISM="Pyrodinium bahamense, Strain pbaha01" /LENGTH=185 /DNA_ID=CAMNT_0020911987 /DNA_START=453 /DNA_END=1011 /DNA_ORIENTATION=+